MPHTIEVENISNSKKIFCKKDPKKGINNTIIGTNKQCKTHPNDAISNNVLFFNIILLITIHSINYLVTKQVNTYNRLTQKIN